MSTKRKHADASDGTRKDGADDAHALDAVRREMYAVLADEEVRPLVLGAPSRWRVDRGRLAGALRRVGRPRRSGARRTERYFLLENFPPDRLEEVTRCDATLVSSLRSRARARACASVSSAVCGFVLHVCLFCFEKKE